MIRARRNRSALLLLAALLVLLVCLDAREPVRADDATPGEIGLEIAREAYARAEGFGNYTASVVMVLRNK